MDKFQHLKTQLEDIKLATNNFADNEVIGSGGFGKVYKGEISHSKGRCMAAFKKLDRIHGQGNPQFVKEIILLSRYTHENLVSLLGYCDEGGEKILVYEHASRGSLNRYVSVPSLTRTQRLKICLEAARGLSYLHDPKGTPQIVLHRDIKSHNILLDDNWNAKVSDFGLSKAGHVDPRYTVDITCIAGTKGYIDPLYMETGFLTKESDVYSFGVVLVEVLCGKLIHQGTSLVHVWKKSYQERTFEEIIFQDMKQQMNLSSLEQFSNIAYKCLHRSRKSRPTMAHVMEELNNAFVVQKNYEETLGYKDAVNVDTPTVKREVLGEEIIDVQTLGDLVWEQKLPSDYENIIKCSKDNMQWTMKKELYIIFCNGFLINNSEEWFSIDKNGKKCHMLPARAIFQRNYWSWESSPESRFGELACNPPERINIFCKLKPQLLSPRTRYACYLVYKLPKSKLRLDAPILAVSTFYVTQSWFIYLECPQTPFIGPKVDENTDNPLNRPKMKGLPRLRTDGWMEVQVWEFQTYGMRDITMQVDLTCSFSKLLKRFLVVGIEFKPM